MLKLRSIRGQLVALVLAFVLPVALLEAVGMADGFRASILSAQREVVTVAEEVATRVEQFLDQSERMVEAFASSSGPDDLRPGACQSRVEELGRIVPQIHNAVLVRPDGRIACSSLAAPHEGYVIPMEPWLGPLLEKGGPVISAPRLGPVTNTWLLTLAAPVRDDDGAIVGAAGLAIDVHRLQELITPPGAGQGLVTVMDDQGLVVARSRAAEAFLGRPIDIEAVGGPEVDGTPITRAPDAEGMPHTFARVDIPERGWRVFAGLPDEVIYPPARAEVARRAVRDTILILLMFLLAGTFYRRIRHALASLRIGVDAAAQGRPEAIPVDGPVEVRAVGRELRDAFAGRFRAEAAERRANERYRSVLENAVFGVFVATTDGRFLEVNPALAELLGHDAPREVVERGLADLFRRPAVHRELLEGGFVGLDGTVREVETEWLRADGSPILVRLNGRLVREGEGHVLQVIVEDITEHRRLEDEYRHAQKMEAVGRLAGGIAHDFNNLLTVILGHADLLTEQLAPDSDGHREGLEIAKAGQRAAALTSQLLAFSRKNVSTPVVVDLGDSVRAVTSMVDRVIGADVRLSTEASPEPLPVRLDPGHLEQALMNLIVNARDAVAEGGRITVRTDAVEFPEPVGDRAGPPGAYARLTVSDDGVGMTPAVRDRIFEPFFTTKPKGRGTGLGLASLYGFVVQTGGHVEVETAEGVGTSFHLLFPLLDGPGDRDASEAESDARQDQGGSSVILVAEDEATVRRIVERVLKAQGYRVRTAPNGAAALELFEESPESFDLLVTDIVMPRMKGPELAQAVLERRPDLPVLFISGYTASADLESLLARPVSSFLAKPFSPDELRERVIRLLAGHGPVDDGEG